MKFFTIEECKLAGFHLKAEAEETDFGDSNDGEIRVELRNLKTGRLEIEAVKKFNKHYEFFVAHEYYNQLKDKLKAREGAA